MKTSKTLLALLSLAMMAGAGCGGDMAKQVVSNEQFRGQVLDSIAQHKDLALQTVDRIAASDSLRTVVVDHLLLNEKVAQQVLVRIGTNPAALDMVIGIAARDSLTREHVLTLAKGIQMGSGK
jgi:hypothetical protein